MGSVKARANVAKFAEATAVFEDPRGLSRDDPHPSEERFVTLGLDALGRLLVVCWTPRGKSDIRIISARRATRSESRQYEQVRISPIVDSRFGTS